MPVARLLRILTLVVSFAALQLTLLSGGPGCPMPTGGAHGASVAPMAGMEMAGPAATSHTSSHSSPCENATAPEHCPTMAPCLFAIVLPTADAQATAASEPSTVIVAIALAPPSISAAPELPPPRA